MDSTGSQASLLDYARSHGLALNHTDTTHERFAISISVLSRLLVDNSISDHDVQQPLVNEKLLLDRKSRAWLSAVVAPKNSEWLQKNSARLFVQRKLKLELPILRTDNELDVRLAGGCIMPYESFRDLPLWKLDGEPDHESVWTEEGKAWSKYWERECLMEKLPMSQEAAFMIQACFNQAHDAYNALEHDSTVHKRSMHACLSPPLSPLTPPLKAHSVSLETQDIALFSTGSDHTAKTANNVCDSLMSKDDSDMISNQNLLLDCWSHYQQDEEITENISGSDDVILVSSTLHQRPSDIKLETPLTPPGSVETTKHVSWSDELDRIIPTQCWRRASTESGESIDGLEACFYEVIRSEALRVEDELRDEKLQEADALMRVTVPLLDFSKPTPPWICQSPNSSNIEDVQTLIVAIAKLKCHHWGASKIEKALTWVPLTLTPGSTMLYEAIDDDGLVNHYTKCQAQADFVDLDSLSWKPDGLRLLDDNYNEEEEITHDQNELGTCINCFVNERKRQLTPEIDQSRKCSAPYSMENPTHPSLNMPALMPRSAETASSVHLNIQSSSAAEQVGRFMEMRSGLIKRRKLLSNAATEILEVDLFDEATTAIGMKQGEYHSIPVLSLATPFPEPSSLVLPKCHVLNVSSHVLSQRRQLIKQIIRLCPAIEVVPRESLVCHSGLTAESAVDFVLSPGVGIICTTLQGIQQRPLPGQNRQALIHSHIATAASLFEKLLVLINANRIHTAAEAELDEGECRAMTTLIDFAASLEDEVIILFVGGAEAELACWIVGLIGSPVVSAKSLKLLQDETMWEYILCKTGLNTFAAQVVLSEVKEMSCAKSVSIGEHTSGQSGLAAFMGMEFSQRIARFTELLGGEKALRKVGNVLDSSWNGAGHV